LWLNNINLFYICVAKTLTMILNASFLFFILLFTFTHRCIHCWATSLPVPTPASMQNLFHPLVLQFCWRDNIEIIRKTQHFYLLEMKIAIQRDSQCCFHTPVYRKPHWFMSTRPLHYILAPFPWFPSIPLEWPHQQYSRSKFPSLSLFLPCAISP
jgi:hypothetical protein